MADTNQTPRDEPEPAADQPAATEESATGTSATEESGAGESGTEASGTEASGTEASDATESASTESASTTSTEKARPSAPANDGTGNHAPDTASAPDDAEPGTGSEPETEPEPIGTDDAPTGPSPTRIAWVVAAFLFFWPLAIPALVLSMRTAEANGTGSFRRAKKSSVHTLDFALGAVTVGALGIVGLAIGIVAAPTYASSLPPDLVSAARSFVPPALAGPLGITVPDDGDEPATAPTPTPTPSDPYATADPYLPGTPDPYAEDPADDADPQATPETDDLDPADAPTSASGTTATAGAEIPDLRVGDCIDTGATAGQTILYRIPVVACTTVHGGEIYAETTAPDNLAESGETPTQQALWGAADSFCYPQFTEFVGMRWARSELQYWPIAPSEESWAEGDRRILCVVESETPVTGTLEGAER